MMARDPSARTRQGGGAAEYVGFLQYQHFRAENTGAQCRRQSGTPGTDYDYVTLTMDRSHESLRLFIQPSVVAQHRAENPGVAGVKWTTLECQLREYALSCHIAQYPKGNFMAEISR